MSAYRDRVGLEDDEDDEEDDWAPGDRAADDEW
jgi:hypothetical protein